MYILAVADLNLKLARPSLWYLRSPFIQDSFHADNIKSALFNFQSLLMVILLLICTSTYIHSYYPTFLDARKNG